MARRIILDRIPFSLTIDRLCIQIIENHRRLSESCLIGVQPRGVHLSRRIRDRLAELAPGIEIPYGELDHTFYRDDFRMHGKPLMPMETRIDFSVEGKRVILVDDVLFTGRTIRSAMEALIDYGRPDDVELLVLIDRRLQRHLPIQAKYVGKVVDSITSEQVRVEWEADGRDAAVWIIPANEKEE